MVIYDKKHETIGVPTISEATVLAQGFANNEDTCSSVADDETADVATVFGKIEIETDGNTGNKAYGTGKMSALTKTRWVMET